MIKDIINYLLYVYETVDFNRFYRNFHGSKISRFDNCSWSDWKRNSKESEVNEQKNSNN